MKTLKFLGEVLDFVAFGTTKLIAEWLWVVIALLFILWLFKVV